MSSSSSQVLTFSEIGFSQQVHSAHSAVGKNYNAAPHAA